MDKVSKKFNEPRSPKSPRSPRSPKKYDSKKLYKKSRQNSPLSNNPMLNPMLTSQENIMSDCCNNI